MKLSVDQLRRSVGVGLVFGTAMTCWVMGLVHITSLGEGAFLTSLGVVIVPIIARLVFKEAQPASTWLAIPIAVAGLALLSLKTDFALKQARFSLLWQRRSSPCISISIPAQLTRER